MKRIFFIIYCLLIVNVVFAQNDVTKFLGIPVDGSKSEMIRKLESKGFTLIKDGNDDLLKGRFNGMNVNVHISTEKGKVDRIMICDEGTLGETDIKIRFNHLCQQFKDNGKYISIGDFFIPEGEDIPYEMAVNNKRYEAIFFQLPEEESLKKFQATILSQIQSKYTPEQLQNSSEETKKEIFLESVPYLLDSVKHKSVWFMISEFYGQYYITMFYDNEYNKANGEDL